MEKELVTFIVGGKAGEGVKKAGSVTARMMLNNGYNIFQLDDYMSLIRGGHNFSVISASKRRLNSHYMSADLIVNFDNRSYETHKNHLAKDGLMVYNSDEVKNMDGYGVPLSTEAADYSRPQLMVGVGAVAIIAASLGIKKDELNQIIEQEYKSGVKDNISYANRIHDIVYPEIGGRFKLTRSNKRGSILTGNQAISLGAIAAGLDVYYGYPMTPASSILHFLADQAQNFGLAVVHAESELAVINMAIGSSYSGAKTMVGTSGGGFSLMTEGFSLAGMTEAPVLVILSMRPGPATGVPTYTEQADLNFALHAGHGDFLRIVASPGTIEEAFYLTSELLDLVWRFQTPGILLTEKHLSESSMNVELAPTETKWAKPKMHGEGNYKRYLDTEDGISPMLFPPSKELIKWNSYEHDELGITTENPKVIQKMHDKREKKSKKLMEQMKDMKTINTFGTGEQIIITYGSTTMSVLEALTHGNIDGTVIQPIYLRPFPDWNFEQYRDKKPIIVEMSSTGQFSNLIREKTGMSIKADIRKYDGRPFDPIELSNKISEVM
ncbi:MAG: 2-oxoacid:acceptor oxidoreductase subunit alpha [Promethearchaeota archaeon]|nr:MAG: 2-oxoacid:acceptor oxidoreductase subunit alpha [Candidatus Lokiarchaeota archaeon]